MDLYSALLKPLLFQLDAEAAHDVTMNLLRLGGKSLLPLAGVRKSDLVQPTEAIEVAGMFFRNRIGLAAGFDKNAYLTQLWPHLGFGHVEIGTVTPRPQPGNPKARMFRLPKDEALINRMGFNSEGAEAIRIRLEKERPDSGTLIIGGNIGKNKETTEEEAYRDYLICLEALHEVVDYFTINISSPNTAGLRSLQSREPLWKLLGTLQERNQKFGAPRPIFVKVAPDLDELALADLALVVQETGCSGIVATNTTTSRAGLLTPDAEVEKMGAGGLSGKPLRPRAAYFNSILGKLLPGHVTLIASGGIMDAGDVRERFSAGAQLVQVYTGMVYGGPAFVGQCLKAANEAQNIPAKHKLSVR